VSSHLTYRIPRQRKHSTGIQFEAIDATESLRTPNKVSGWPVGASR
jgi:hypothetical protein